MYIKKNIVFPEKGVNGHLILCAADSFYFKKFHRQLIDSFLLLNLPQKLHFHIVNPDSVAINIIEKSCKNKNLSFSWEFVDLKNSPDFRFDELKKLPHKILKMLANETYRGKYLAGLISLVLDKTSINPLIFLSNKFMTSLWPKIYYSVSRFLLINEDYFDQCESILIIDIDSIITSNFDLYINENDGIYIKKRCGTWSDHLAGCVYIKNYLTKKFFFKEFTSLFEKYSEKGCFFWGIDQFLIDQLSDKYEVLDIPDNFFSVNPKIPAAIISFKGDAKWKIF